MDFILIVLSAFLVLLIIQIVALVRIRQIINKLRAMLNSFHGRGKHTQLANYSQKSLQSCQFCKFRQTYIKATISGESDDFYYRCKFHHKGVKLNDSCPDFDYENDVLKR